LYYNHFIMQKRLFFLKQDGWFEVEVAAKLLDSSNEELLQWTYAMMDKHGYRNYLITENPAPTIGKRYLVTDTGYSTLDAGYAGREILRKTLLSIKNVQKPNLSPKT
jgi:hypothetical protein